MDWCQVGNTSMWKVDGFKYLGQLYKLKKIQYDENIWKFIHMNYSLSTFSTFIDLLTIYIYNYYFQVIYFNKKKYMPALLCNGHKLLAQIMKQTSVNKFKDCFCFMQRFW